MAGPELRGERDGELKRKEEGRRWPKGVREGGREGGENRRKRMRVEIAKKGEGGREGRERREEVEERRE